MEYLPFVMFLLGGLIFSLTIHSIRHSVPYRIRRWIIMFVLLFAIIDASFFTVLWWQAVILGKGGLWTVKHYFPVPGLWYTGAVMLGEMVAGYLVWITIARSARRS